LTRKIDSEIERVLREIAVIEARAIARWRALPPPTVTGQPPTAQNSGTEAIETLGQLLNFDRNMSPFRNQACSSCHMPYAGFSGPIPSVNLTMIAYPGTFHFRAGKRTAQRYTYAPFFPVLQFNEVPRTTNFCIVDSWDPDGTSDDVKSTVKRFTTPQHP